MGQLSVGVQLPEVERDVRWPEIVSMARAAEATGFDSVWLGDHLLYRGDGRPERVSRQQDRVAGVAFPQVAQHRP